VKATARNDAFELRFHFHGDLPFFVRPNRGTEIVVRELRKKTSVKDAIEACGVPHPEVDLILVENKPIDFGYQLTATANIDVYPVAAPAELFLHSRLQRRDRTRFIADGHLGKLTRDLRLLGIDVVCPRDPADRALVELSVTEDRALLTRDRPLLMHAAIRDGYYPRSQQADEQTREVIRRFELRDRITPFSRCLHCNGLLADVAKEEVFDQLEPLTKLYYETFRRCRQCGGVYWSGSHFEKLQQRLERLLAPAS
jgi:uncharacterized protein with PIN domain